MNIFELIVMGFALSMDSFSAAVCKGIEIPNLTIKKMTIVSLWFAFFQAIMPLLGFLLASIFKETFITIVHWISFFLLLYLGLNMFKEAKNKEENYSQTLAFKEMFFLSLAISLDAFTVGITYSFLGINISLATFLTYIITFITTFIGTKIGQVFGKILNEKALILGGLVLISLGLKILLEHLFC